MSDKDGKRRQIDGVEGLRFSLAALQQRNKWRLTQLVGELHGSRAETVWPGVNYQGDDGCVTSHVAFRDAQTGRGYEMVFEWEPERGSDGYWGLMLSAWEARYEACDATGPTDSECLQPVPWREDFERIADFVRRQAVDASRRDDYAAQEQAYAYSRVYAYMQGVAEARGVPLPSITPSAE